MVGAATNLLILSGCGSGHPNQRLTNDAYVWQRRWTPAVVEAVRRSAASVRAWRVLAAEEETQVGLTKFGVNRQALRQAANPVMVVIRIDGRIGGNPLADQVAVDSVALAREWKKEGVPVCGIEIDYDCATNRLPRYRNFLQAMRTKMPREMTLSITALPSWIGSNDLAAVLSQVDESVLQVHSVMNPREGLFDRATAYRWADDWSRISTKPFLMALPTYWSRISWDKGGRVVAIESEVARYGDDGVGREMPVEPQEVSGLLADLERARPRHLEGIAWFRLPTETDGRAWSTETWRAVMAERPLAHSLPVVHFRADANGAQDVYLRNESTVDTKLPSRVSLAGPGCEFADAMAPYRVERQTNGFEFRLTDAGLLRANEQQVIGWLRCRGEKLEAHVSF